MPVRLHLTVATGSLGIFRLLTANEGRFAPRNSAVLGNFASKRRCAPQSAGLSFLPECADKPNGGPKGMEEE